MTPRPSLSARTARIKAETRQRVSDRPARVANVEVRAGTTTLRAPWRPDRKLPGVTVNIVLVEETGTPAGQEPIQWLLLTTLPIETEEQVRAIVASYCQRWGIEVDFKTLKSGCRIAERHFESLDRERNCLALDMIIAWRTLLLCRLGRQCPDLDCETVFEPSERKSVDLVVTKREPPKKAPKLNDLIRLIASLGGDINRKTSEPGTQTLWFGLQRLNDFANCYDSFGPNSKKT